MTVFQSDRPRRSRRAGCLALVMLAFAAVQFGVGAAPQAARSTVDVVYATVDGKPLALDLHLPAGATTPPLVVWVHGGAWRSGDKSEVPRPILEKGFAIASVNYRLSGDARFPAAVHDIKAAVRFVRANAAKFGYRADRIAIGGSSAGAHLAALVGVTNGHKDLEGSLGAHLSTSSNVQAILDYYGASDLTTILDQSTPFGLGVRIPALEQWLGGRPESVKALAQLASPVLHVDRSDPPLHLLHGDRDPQMPINQAHQLEGAYKALGLDVALDVVHGAGHGGTQFYAPAHLEKAVAFLRRTIGG